MFLSRGFKKLPKNWAGLPAVRYRKAVSFVSLHMFEALEWSSEHVCAGSTDFSSGCPCGVGCAK